MLGAAVRSRSGGRMYRFRLERTDGSPADPPTYRSTVLSWRQGDVIPLGALAVAVAFGGFPP